MKETSGKREKEMKVSLSPSDSDFLFFQNSSIRTILDNVIMPTLESSERQCLLGDESKQMTEKENLVELSNRILNSKGL